MRNFLIVLAATAIVVAGCKADLGAPVNISVDTQADASLEICKGAKIYNIFSLSDSLLVGEVSKAQHHNGKLCVWDKSSKGILCYDLEGNLLFNINSVGRGPEEYSGISNFYLSGRKNSVNIIAPEKKLLEYCAKSGELLSVSQIGAQTIMFTDGAEHPLGSNVLGIVGPKHNLALCGTDSITYHIPFNMARDFCFMEKAFANDGEQLLFVHGMDNNIYAVGADSVVVKYIVDFGGLEISNTDYETLTPQKIQEIYSAREVATRVDNLVSTPYCLAFSYWKMYPNKEQQTQYALYNKKNGEVLGIKENILFPIKCAAGDHFISIIENPAEILNLPPNKTLCIPQKLREYLTDGKFTQESNPVVVVWGI